MSLASSFNYGDLDPETGRVVRQAAEEIKDRIKRTRQDIIEIGERLIEVKERLGHGQFGEWLKTEFDWAERTAYNFMDVAKAFKSANFANLDIGPSALYTLSAPSVPEAARQEAIERASNGHHVGYLEAKQIVEEHTPNSTSKPSLFDLLFSDPEEDARQQQQVEAGPPDPDEDEDEDDAGDSPASSSGLSPAEVVANAARWIAFIEHATALLSGIIASGGIVNVTATWPHEDVVRVHARLGKLMTYIEQCVRELEERYGL